jgi:hypothetical protein
MSGMTNTGRHVEPKAGECRAAISVRASAAFLVILTVYMLVLLPGHEPFRGPQSNELGQPWQNGSFDGSNDGDAAGGGPPGAGRGGNLKRLLCPADHVERNPRRQRMFWNVTSAFVRPDGVLKKVKLING